MNNFKFATSDAILKMVRAFSDDVFHDVHTVKDLLGLKRYNSKYSLAWDVRYSRIEDLEGNNNLVALTSRRAFWEFSMLLNIVSGTLFVFTKEKNFEVVQKKFGNKTIHYIHSLLFINNKYDEDFDSMYEDFQLALQIGGIEDFNARRKLDAIKILGDYYSDVNQVIIVTLTEENREAVKVEASVFTSDCQLIDKEDWSAFIHHNFNDGIGHTEDEYNNPSKTSKEKPILSLKPEYSKASRTDKEKPIVAERKHKSEKKEE